MSDHPRPTYPSQYRQSSQNVSNHQPQQNPGAYSVIMPSYVHYNSYPQLQMNPQMSFPISQSNNMSYRPYSTNAAMPIRDNSRGQPNQQQHQQHQQQQQHQQLQPQQHNLHQQQLTHMSMVQKIAKPSRIKISICDASGAEISAKELANKKPSYEVEQVKKKAEFTKGDDINNPVKQVPPKKIILIEDPATKKETKPVPQNAPVKKTDCTQYERAKDFVPKKLSADTPEFNKSQNNSNIQETKPISTPIILPTKNETPNLNNKPPIPESVKNVESVKSKKQLEDEWKLRPESTDKYIASVIDKPSTLKKPVESVLEKEKIIKRAEVSVTKHTIKTTMKVVSIDDPKSTLINEDKKIYENVESQMNSTQDDTWTRIPSKNNKHDTDRNKDRHQDKSNTNHGDNSNKKFSRNNNNQSHPVNHSTNRPVSAQNAHTSTYQAQTGAPKPNAWGCRASGERRTTAEIVKGTGASSTGVSHTAPHPSSHTNDSFDNSKKFVKHEHDDSRKRNDRNDRNDRKDNNKRDNKRNDDYQRKQSFQNDKSEYGNKNKISQQKQGYNNQQIHHNVQSGHNQSNHPQPNQRRHINQQKNPQTMRQTSSSNEKPPLAANKPPPNLAAIPTKSAWNTNNSLHTQPLQKPVQQVPKHLSSQPSPSNQAQSHSNLASSHHSASTQQTTHQAPFKPVPTSKQPQLSTQKHQAHPQTSNNDVPVPVPAASVPAAAVPATAAASVTQQNIRQPEKLTTDTQSSKVQEKADKINAAPESKTSTERNIVYDKKNEITDVAVLLNNDNRVAIKDTNTKVALKNTKTELVVSPVKKKVEQTVTPVANQTVSVDKVVENEAKSKIEKDKTANELRDFSKPVFKHPIPAEISKPVTAPAAPVSTAPPVAPTPIPAKTKIPNVPSKTESEINKIKQIEYRNDQWSPDNQDGKKQYDRSFLINLQYTNDSLKKPTGLEKIPDIILNEPFKNDMNMSSDYSTSLFKNNQNPRSSMNKRGSMQKNQRGSMSGPPGSMQGNAPMVINISIKKEELHHAKDAWKPPSKSKDNEDNSEELYKNIRAILNKLTPEKFDKLSETAMELPIHTNEEQTKCIDIIFDKAVDEPNFAATYADLCGRMKNMKTTDEKSRLFYDGIITKAKQLFMQKTRGEKFEELTTKIANTQEADKKKEYENRLKIMERNEKKRYLGNVRFIGELYKKNLIDSKKVTFCCKNLLYKEVKDSSQNQVRQIVKDEEKLECLCRLLMTIGQKITLENKSTNLLNEYYNSVGEIIKDKESYNSRLRFMMQDLMDLKSNNWVLRRTDNVPVKIDEIHKQAEKEANDIANSTKIAKMNTSNSYSDIRSLQRNKPQPLNDGWSKNTRALPSKLRLPKNEPETKARINWSLGSAGSGGRNSSAELNKNKVNDTSQMNRFTALQSETEDLINFNRNKEREDVINSARLIVGNAGSSMQATPETSRPESPVKIEVLSQEQINFIRVLIGDIAECLSDLEILEDVKKITHSMNSLVYESFMHVTGAQKHTSALSKLFTLLFSKKMLKDVHFITGYISFIDTFKKDSMLLDCPLIVDYLAKITSPLVFDDNDFNFKGLLDMNSELADIGTCDFIFKILANKLELEAKDKNVVKNNIYKVWFDSGCKFSDFMVADSQVSSLLKKYNLEFLEMFNKEYFSTLFNEVLIKEDNVQSRTRNILTWLEKSVTKEVYSSAEFLRLASFCIFKYCCERKIQSSPYFPIIMAINVNANDIEILYAGQECAHSFEFPTEFLNSLFGVLYGDECVSENAFILWKTNGTVQVGRNLAIENVSRFYKWFEESKPEDGVEENTS